MQSGVTTRDVSFSMDSMHTFPRGLQLISLPADYGSVDPADLLAVPRDQFRMATYEASRQRYRLYPDAPADRFRVGVGYWMNLSAAADLSQEGFQPPNPAELPLVAGWNLLGTPANRRLDFYLTRVRRAGLAQEYTLTEAMSAGILGSGLFAYALGGYQSVATLAPYVGYWLKANEACTLIIDSQVAGLSAGAVADRPGVMTPQDGWLLQLRASTAAALDTSAYLGAAPQATSGVDRGLDQAKPPVPAMGPYVYAAFTDDQWSSGDQSVDIRKLSQSSVWNMRVRTNQIGERVALAWPDMRGLPAGVRPILTDLSSGTRVYMRTASSYGFVARAEEHRLQVTVEPDGVGQLLVTTQSAVSTGAGASVGYVLSQGATVAATVTNMAGRVVRQVTTGELQTAGRHELLWDGRAANGLRVPVGRYFVTITARTATGQEVRAVAPLSYLPR